MRWMCGWIGVGGESLSLQITRGFLSCSPMMPRHGERAEKSHGLRAPFFSKAVQVDASGEGERPAPLEHP